MLIEADVIESNIVLHASGHNSQTIKVFADGITKIINDVKLLHGINNTLTEDEVGLKAYEQMKGAIELVGDEFSSIVYNNFNLEGFKRRIVLERAQFEEEISAKTSLTEEVLYQPQQEIFDLRASLEIEKLTSTKSEGIMTRSRSASGGGLEQDDEDVRETKQLEDAIRRIKRNSDIAYLEAYDQYTASVTIKANASKELRLLHSNLTKSGVLELSVTSLLEVMRKLVVKLKDVIDTKHPMIKAKLKTTAVLSSTGDEISNPWDRSHLPGLMQLLRDNYYKKSIVSFTNSLMDAMGWRLSEDDTIQNPVRGVNEVESLVHNWKSRDLWQQMTEDMFFTAILLNGLHPNVPFRREVITETVKYGRDIETRLLHDGDNSSLPPSGLRSPTMPIFRFVSDFIRTEQNNRKLTDKSSAKKDGFIRHTAKSASSHSNKSNVENAASVSDSELAASTTTSSITRKYNAEILPSQQITVVDPHGKIQRVYVAVLKQSTICSKCYPDPANSNSAAACQRKCYANRCGKCWYYGHKNATCMQTHTNRGVEITG